MKSHTKYLLIGASALALAGATVIGNYVSYANTGNRMEKSIKATHENNQNVLAQFGQKVAEVAQVPDMMRDDVTKVTTAAIQGRYGSDGSKAVFQWIQEQNPVLDSKVYLQIQQIIESGRNEFQAAQSKLIDQRRQYETSLGNVWSGWWMSLAGYPKVDLEKEYLPISTERAIEAFKVGVEKPMKLRR